MGTALAWEVVCHFRKKWTSITALVVRLWMNPFGRMAYVVIWAFFRVALFARYTIPR